MPQSTPIYGFTYPCPGELVTPASIALMAGQIDTKMADVDTDWVDMLRRRNSGPTVGTTQNIAAGAETALTTPTYTFPVAGIYIVRASAFQLTLPATRNMFRARLRINGVVRGFGTTMNTENGIGDSPHPNVPMVAAAGDVASITCIFNGTGTLDVQGHISAKLVCRIA